MPAFYAFSLLIAFYALIVAEVLIPSGGLLGVSAAIVAVTSVIIGFTHSVTLGGGLFVVYLVTTPVLFALLIKLWPKTRIGRQMLNRDTLESHSAVPPAMTLDGARLDEMVGFCGVATADLLPHGQVKVNGHKANAVSTGLAIEKGTPIWTVRVQGRELLVRTATEAELANSEAGQDAPAPHVEAIRSTLEDINLEDINLDDVNLDDIANISPIDEPEK